MKYSGIGGQAVMEGVMMRNGDKYAIAVRTPENRIEVKVERTGAGEDFWHKTPLVRGVVSFAESLGMGLSALSYSASFFEDEEQQKPRTEEEQAKQEKKDKAVMGGTMIVSFLVAMALFMVLPFYLSRFLGKVIPWMWLVNLIEGIIRIVIFIGYVVLISRMEDIRRVFMYHGAEHKCINCIEHGMELNVENVRKSSKQHRRCGTSFLLIVFVISVVVFMFVHFPSRILQLACRLLLIPVIAGVAYEFIRLAGRSESRLVQVLSAPGLWLQNLTTREPEDDMIEVGIASVEAVFDWRAFLEENREDFS